jgi:hypothetical protein
VTESKDAAVITSLEDLIPDDHNCNKGTERGIALLETSLERLGAGRSILVDRKGKIIAGNKTAQAAVEKGLPVEVVQTDGTTLVIVQRTDLDMDEDAGARELAVADNRTAEVGLDWDAVELQAVVDMGADLSGFFVSEELEKLGVIMEAPSPQDESGVPRLDKKKSVTCPECHHEFIPS